MHKLLFMKAVPLFSSKSVPFVLLICLLITAPIPFASNRALFWLMDCLLISTIAITFFWNLAKNRKPLTIDCRHIRISFIAYIAVLLWAFIQLLALPWPPSFNPYWSIMSNTLGQEKISFFSISVDRFTSFDGLVRWICYGLVFLIGLQFGRRLEKSSILLKVILYTCLSCALYGLINYASGTDMILWIKKHAYIDDLTGTFINRNNFATYMGFGVLISTHYLIDRLFQGTKYIQGKALLRTLLNNFISSGASYFLMLAVFFSALVLTHSRAGMACTLIALIIQLILHIRAFKRNNNIIMLVSSFLIVLTLCVSFLWVGGNQLAERFASLPSELRPDIYRVTWMAIQNNYWLGSGLGSFEDMFNIYRDNLFPHYILSKIDHSHNTYLESLLELGLPAFLLLVISIGYLIFLCLKGALTRKKNSRFSRVAVSISVLVWTHALVDFSIEMPAISISYALLLALGVAQSWSSKDLLCSAIRQDKQRPIVQYYFFILVGASTLGSTIVMLPNAFKNYQLEILVNKNYFNEELSPQQAQTLLERKSHWFPLSGDTYAKMAYIGIQLAYDAKTSALVNNAYLINAEKHLLEAVSSKPINSTSWLRLAYLSEQDLLKTDGSNINELLYTASIMSPYRKDHILYIVSLLPSVWFSYTDNQHAYFLDQIAYIWEIKNWYSARKRIFDAMNNTTGIYILQKAIPTDSDGRKHLEELIERYAN